MKILLVVDMQNDFIDGALGTAEAVAIIPKVVEKISAYRERGDKVIFTQDTHFKDYLKTQEGQILPIPHCIKYTPGWEITDKIDVMNDRIIQKSTFTARWFYNEDVESVEIVGLCTDICVVSNALYIKGLETEMPIYVDASCCAGTTPKKHEAALSVMESCQINITNRNNKGKDTFDQMLEMIKEGRSAEEIKSVIGDFGITYMEHGIKFPWQK